MRVRSLNPEVSVAEDFIVRLARENILGLKDLAARNARRRMRLCAHQDVSDPLHEMFIVHTKDTYVRPHKHLANSESLHVLEGEADVVLFDEKGKLSDVFAIGPYGSTHSFYYRISENIFHALVIRSEYFVFHEVTAGPFDRTRTVFAPWAPEENQSSEVLRYLSNLQTQIDQFHLGRGSTS